MAKVDLHVHSSYSERPSEWFLQRLGTRESYIDPEQVYEAAKKEGMDFVTLTDHNTIEGAVKLKRKHPHDVIIGVEATTYFPENGAKVHILVWGLSESQFRAIEAARNNIYELRQLLIQEELTHAVAHPTFQVNGLLTFEQLEQLFVLFDVFETNNGSRQKNSFDVLDRVFASMNRNVIDTLSEKYGLKPVSAESWVKGQVGGSDDHSGLFSGRTYTCADAGSPDEFLARIRQKQTRPEGRNNDYRGLAFAVYKVAYDFSRSRSTFSDSLMGAVNALIFDSKAIDLKKKLTIRTMKKWSQKKAKNEPLPLMLAELITVFQENKEFTADEKLEFVSGALTNASDELLHLFFTKVTTALKDGDLLGLVKSVSTFLPGVFLSLPFFTSMNVLSTSRILHEQLEVQYVLPRYRRKKKVLWFTDTLGDLNGVSETLKELVTLARKRNLDLTIMTCLAPDENGVHSLEKNPRVVDLPCIHSYTPEFFNTYTLRVPSVLGTLKLASDYEPDEIYISTPGAVGLLGLLIARLFHVQCTAVYHTDFTNQFKFIIDDTTMCRFTEEYVNWFYSQADTIAVPTQHYAQELAKRGMSLAKLRQFRRGIDPLVFAPVGSKEYLLKEFGITDGVTLLYSGRISKEKNIDFLFKLYEKLVEQHPKINLILAGDGPCLAEYKKRYKKCKRIHFSGRVARKELPKLYASSDIFVFPSVTDTFGMVVLEAQCCGVPAVVSDCGGPQEIIINGKTGYVAAANDLEDWSNKILAIVEMIRAYPYLYLELRAAARKHIVSTYNWNNVLNDIFGTIGQYDYENDVEMTEKYDSEQTDRAHVLWQEPIF
jgi:glycosyltransferase involved in cell wall biosynthesis